MATAFGRDIKVQGGEAEELYQHAQAILEGLVRNTGGQFSAFLTFGGEIEQGGLCSTLVYLSVSVYVSDCMCVYPCLCSWYAMGYKGHPHVPAVHQAGTRNGVLDQFSEEGSRCKVQPKYTRSK